ncbi:MAG: hypothetical protein AMS14_04805 [Planctomycetes bacterium DG_20]|nr:MAG: hypothetical protein AMS14_04805 [Planctomycetes bacterium DG_20]
MRSQNAVGMAYQFVVRYHSLRAVEAAGTRPGLAVSVDYDRTELRTGGVVRVRAAVTNRTATDARMVLVDIGTPPGFAVRPAGLEKLRERGAIQRYTLTARGVIVYLDRLPAGRTLAITYEMTARMPLRAVARPTTVYAYYDPDRRAAARPATFVVR